MKIKNGELKEIIDETLKALIGTDISNEELKKYNAYAMGPDKKVIYLTFDEGTMTSYLPQIVEVLNNNNVVNGEMVGLKDNVIILNNATEYYNGKLLNSYNGFVDNSTFYVFNIIEDTKEFKLYNK